jgi:ABC transporter transmembrane region
VIDGRYLMCKCRSISRILSTSSTLISHKLLRRVQFTPWYLPSLEPLFLAVYVLFEDILTSDGLARIGASVFHEIRNAIFANVAQRAIRQVACNTFSHLLAMDLAFHLSRQTGGLSRAIDRGTKGISSVLTWIVFHIAPTLLEIGMVSAILVYSIVSVLMIGV